MEGKAAPFFSGAWHHADAAGAGGGRTTGSGGRDSDGRRSCPYPEEQQLGEAPLRSLQAALAEIWQLGRLEPSAQEPFQTSQEKRASQGSQRLTHGPLLPIGPFHLRPPGCGGPFHYAI